MARKPYPSDVTDEEWAFVAPYLTLMREDAPQRDHPLREVFNGLRWIVRAGAPWRLMPNDLPPWHTVYQQTQRWLKAGVFEALVHDVRMLLREITDRMPQPPARHLRCAYIAVESRKWCSCRLEFPRCDGHQHRPGCTIWVGGASWER